MREYLDNSTKESRRMEKINGHFMENKDEYLKELYLTFLFAVSDETGLTERRIELLYKLSNGLKLKYEQILKKAKTINGEFFTEVLKNFKDKEELEYLLIDMLILLNIDSDFDEKHSKLTILIFEMFGLDKIDTNKIIEKTKYILCLNIERKYYNNYPLIIRSIIIENSTIFDEVFFEDDKIFLNCELNFDLKGKFNFKKGNIKFINCKLISPKLFFTNNNNIELINCKLTGKLNELTYIQINKCNQLNLIDNEFGNIENKSPLDKQTLIDVDTLKTLMISGNKFINCSSISNYYSYFINILSIDKLLFTNNIFDNCRSITTGYTHGDHGYDYCFSYAYLLCLSKIKEFEFINNKIINCMANSIISSGTSYNYFYSYILTLSDIFNCKFINNIFKNTSCSSKEYNNFILVSNINSYSFNNNCFLNCQSSSFINQSNLNFCEFLNNEFLNNHTTYDIIRLTNINSMRFLNNQITSCKCSRYDSYLVYISGIKSGKIDNPILKDSKAGKQDYFISKLPDFKEID